MNASAPIPDTFARNAPLDEFPEITGPSGQAPDDPTVERDVDERQGTVHWPAADGEDGPVADLSLLYLHSDRCGAIH